MSRRSPLPRPPLALVAGVLAAACVAPPARPGALPPVQLDAVHDGGYSATVLSGSDLGSGRSLADALSGRVLGLRFRQGPTDPCPRVTLRGSHSLMAASGAEVYLNGFRMANACILQDLQPRAVARVEIYPGGQTQRIGYAPHPGGLILVFTAERAARQR